MWQKTLACLLAMKSAVQGARPDEVQYELQGEKTVDFEAGASGSPTARQHTSMRSHHTSLHSPQRRTSWNSAAESSWKAPDKSSLLACGTSCHSSFGARVSTLAKLVFPAVLTASALSRRLLQVLTTVVLNITSTPPGHRGTMAVGQRGARRA